MSFPTVEQFGTHLWHADVVLRMEMKSRALESVLLSPASMTKLKRTLIAAVAASLAASTIAAPPVTRKGTSVLHYQTKNVVEAAVPGGTEAGTLRLQQKEQGNSARQTLQLTFTGLETNASYTLAALTGTNVESVVVATIASDSKGRARVSYAAKNGQSSNSLPDALNPLTDLHAISMLDATTQTVAFAWINAAEDVHYLVKRNLTSQDETALGSISLIGNHNTVNFRLLAGGLAPDATYSLALNSNVLSTATTDAAGRLEITAWPATAPAVLDLRLLELLDGNTNTVLSTSLPK
jgi:hypothetical protein